MPGQKLIEVFGTGPVSIVRAPGRVNLIGDHTDYNGGYVLPAAVDREVRIAFRPSGDSRVEMLSADFPERAAFDLDQVARGRAQGWAKYPMGVAGVLQAEKYPAQGTARRPPGKCADRRGPEFVGGDRGRLRHGVLQRLRAEDPSRETRPHLPARRERVRGHAVRHHGSIRLPARAERLRPFPRLHHARDGTCAAGRARREDRHLRHPPQAPARQQRLQPPPRGMRGGLRDPQAAFPGSEVL